MRTGNRRSAVVIKSRELRGKVAFRFRYLTMACEVEGVQPLGPAPRRRREIDLDLVLSGPFKGAITCAPSIYLPHEWRNRDRKGTLCDRAGGPARDGSGCSSTTSPTRTSRDPRTRRGVTFILRWGVISIWRLQPKVR